MTDMTLLNALSDDQDFAGRHNGPNAAQQDIMLKTISAESVEQLIAQTVPADIRLPEPMKLDPAQSEADMLTSLKAIASKNIINRSYIGQGYYNNLTPNVVLRNVLENPGWYTAYTPYQPEISQGRLESLLNYQQMIMDLTSMELANASLLVRSIIICW
jgi:glycine dehydrogenase